MTLEHDATDSASPVFEPSDTSQPDAPVLYPIGSTAYSKSLVTRVTITDVRHDARQIEWHRGEDPRPFTNSHSIHELSDSDDPYTRAALGQGDNPAQPQEGVNLLLMTLPDDHPMATASYADRMAYFAKTRTAHDKYKAGDYALLGDEWVRIAEVKRQQCHVEFIGTDNRELLDETGLLRRPREWVDMASLTDDLPDDAQSFQIPPHDQMPAPTLTSHPADPTTIDQASTIAEREIDIVEALNKLGAKLSERDKTIKNQEDRIAELEDQLASKDDTIEQLGRWGRETEDVAADLRRDKALVTNNLMKAERERSALSETVIEQDHRIQIAANQVKVLEEENEDLKSKRVQFMTAPTQPRQIETITKADPTMDTLAYLLNEGWRVVFETVYVLPGFTPGIAGDVINQEAVHFLRLEREILTPITPPQDEARAFVMPPRAAEPETGAVSEDESTMHQTPVDIVFHVNEANSILDVYEDIDPRDIDPNLPLMERLRRYGPVAVGRADDLQIMNAMTGVALKWNQETQRLTSHVRPFPVRAIAAAQ